MSYPKIEARWTDKHTGRECRADVLNPGSCWGEVYLLANADCYDPPVFAVESQGECNAEDEFLDTDIGVNICGIHEEDLEDYKNDKPDDDGQYGYDRVTYSPNGEPCDTESLHLWSAPSDLRYFGLNLPPWGIAPKEYDSWIRSLESGIKDGTTARPIKYSWDFSPKREDNRLAYALGFYSVCSNASRASRACRLFLRIAGYPFV